jgi:glutamate-1-semialdehyde aminotransferase
MGKIQRSSIGRRPAASNSYLGKPSKITEALEAQIMDIDENDLIDLTLMPSYQVLKQSK